MEISDTHDRPASIDFRAALNDEQYIAVTAEPGPLLVLAGAGSGKTRTLTYRVAYLVTEKCVHPRNILLLTFTNKAAKEMIGRLQDLIGLYEPRDYWGGTFHHVGNKILRRWGEAVGISRSFTIIDSDESESLLKQVVESEDKTFFKDKTNPKPGPLFSVLSLARNRQQSIQETVERYFPQYSEIKMMLPPFAAAYEAKKRAQNVCDYDDLLELWLRLLKDSPEALRKHQEWFRHVLVDEYQDTNTIQSQIIDLIAGHHQLMAVGDDAQCIYSWRGADFENLMTFEDRHPGTVIHRIETNYRSTPQILQLANGVLDAQPKGRHFDKELRAARKNGQKPMVVQAIDDREQADFILKRTRHLIDDEGVSPSEIAILYRSHFHALEIQLAFSKAGIPYQITSGVKFFERQHVRDLIAFVQFVANPRNESAWNRIAVLLPKVGDKGAQKIYAAAFDHAKLMQRDFIDALATDDVKTKVSKDAKDEWTSFCASLKQISDVMRTGKPESVISTAIDGWYADYMKGEYADYIDRMEELKALIGFASRFDDVAEMLSQVALMNGETSERHVDTPPDTVKLTTVHQSKGLEFDIVFVIGVADGMFPGRRAIEADDVEEERRLFYVAVTRAKNELYICYPKVATRAGPGGLLLTPSRFITELSPDLYDPLRIKRQFGW